MARRQRRPVPALRLERLEAREVPGETLGAVLGAVLSDFNTTFSVLPSASGFDGTDDFLPSDGTTSAESAPVRDSRADRDAPWMDLLVGLSSPGPSKVGSEDGSGEPSLYSGVATSQTEGTYSLQPQSLGPDAVAGPSFGADGMPSTSRPMRSTDEQSLPTSAGAPGPSGTSTSPAVPTSTTIPAVGVAPAPATPPSGLPSGTGTGLRHASLPGPAVGLPKQQGVQSPRAAVHGDAQPGSDGGGSDTSPIVNVSGDVEVRDELWWFGDIPTPENYSTDTTIRLVYPGDYGIWKWDVVSGSDKVEIHGGDITYQPSTTISSLAASTSMWDVAIQVY